MKMNRKLVFIVEKSTRNLKDVVLPDTSNRLWLSILKKGLSPDLHPIVMDANDVYLDTILCANTVQTIKDNKTGGSFNYFVIGREVVKEFDFQ